MFRQLSLPLLGSLALVGAAECSACNSVSPEIQALRDAVEVGCGVDVRSNGLFIQDENDFCFEREVQCSDGWGGCEWNFQACVDVQEAAGEAWKGFVHVDDYRPFGGRHTNRRFATATSMNGFATDVCRVVEEDIRLWEKAVAERDGLPFGE